MIKLHVSIVNWNTRDQLRRCLQSLRGALEGLAAEVTVVDNASRDGSAAMVASEFPEVRLLALGSNLGFAGGNNAALTDVRASYILILNPDVEVTREGLVRLLDFMDDQPQAAAVSPLLVGEDGIPHAGYYRRFPTRAQILLYWTLLGKLFRRVGSLRTRLAEYPLRPGGSAVPVDQIPGAAMLVRGSALERVGLMDPDYFVWFEDVDWCYRARLAGELLFVLPSVTMVHEGGASFGVWDARTRAFQFYRTFFRFLCKHRLDGLCGFALSALSLDLRLRDLVGAARRGLGGQSPAEDSSLRPIRREIDRVVSIHRKGELVRFVDAGSGGGDRPARPAVESGVLRAPRP